MDSQIPNYVVKEWLEEGHLFLNTTLIRTEKAYKNSRFDLYVEYENKKAFIEVKGVTLEENGVVRFPDAPSERAVKHLKELEEAAKEGYETYLFFVIQMRGVRYFTPNRSTHPEFADALVHAASAGVHVLAYDCNLVKYREKKQKYDEKIADNEEFWKMNHCMKWQSRLQNGISKTKETFRGGIM